VRLSDELSDPFNFGRSRLADAFDGRCKQRAKHIFTRRNVAVKEHDEFFGFVCSVLALQIWSAESAKAEESENAV
jgi:hypothetical protein